MQIKLFINIVGIMEKCRNAAGIYDTGMGRS